MFFFDWIALKLSHNPCLVSRASSRLKYSLLSYLSSSFADRRLDLADNMDQMNSTELFTSGRKISSDLLQLVVLFQLRQSPKYRHLAAEEQRFQLWAHSLGLYQQGHASLDYRVRDAEVVKSGFARILEELQTHVCCTFK